MISGCPASERLRDLWASRSVIPSILVSLTKGEQSRTDQFLQCLNCKKTLFALEFEQNLRVCTHCGHHHRLPARTRIQWTFDPGSFQELDTDLAALDPLHFPEYEEKLASA